MEIGGKSVKKKAILKRHGFGRVPYSETQSCVGKL